MLVNDEGNFLTLNSNPEEVVSEDSWDSTYSVEKLLKHPGDQSKSCHAHGCWVYRNEPGEFILNLGEATLIVGIELQNIHSPHFDRHAKEIKVSLSDSQDGPWQEIISEVLPDTRHEEGDLPILNFATKEQTLGQFLKCQIVSHYGSYGGLDYFGLYSGDLRSSSTLIN